MFKKLVLSLGLVLGFANVEAVGCPDFVHTGWSKVRTSQYSPFAGNFYGKSLDKDNGKLRFFFYNDNDTKETKLHRTRTAVAVLLGAAAIVASNQKSRYFVKAKAKKLFAKKANKGEDKKEEIKQEDAQQAE